MISLIASENRSNSLVEPEKVLNVLNETLSVPKKSCSVSMTAPLMHV
jgi:hypothetical protein